MYNDLSPDELAEVRDEEQKVLEEARKAAQLESPILVHQFSSISRGVNRPCPRRLVTLVTVPAYTNEWKSFNAEGRNGLDALAQAAFPFSSDPMGDLSTAVSLFGR